MTDYRQQEEHEQQRHERAVDVTPVGRDQRGNRPPLRKADHRDRDRDAGDGQPHAPRQAGLGIRRDRAVRHCSSPVLALLAAVCGGPSRVIRHPATNP